MQQDNIFKVLKEKYYQPRILYSAKLPSKMKKLSHSKTENLLPTKWP